MQLVILVTGNIKKIKKTISKMQIKKENLVIIFGALAALGGLSTFFTYIESRKSRRTQNEIAELDKQIKSLQLKQLSN